jgi:hypothetical protein
MLLNMLLSSSVFSQIDQHPSAVYFWELPKDKLPHTSLIIFSGCLKHSIARKGELIFFETDKPSFSEQESLFLSWIDSTIYEKEELLTLNITWRRFGGSRWMIFLYLFARQECVWCPRGTCNETSSKGELATYTDQIITPIEGSCGHKPTYKTWILS